MAYTDQMTAVTPFMDSLRAAETHARCTTSWVVVVAPDKLASRLARLLVGTCPADARVAGSTVLLPGGGRVTAVNPLTVLQGTGFFLMLLGFEEALLPSDEIAMHRWTRSASGIVTLGGSRGEVWVH
jgi:hypothetical protein